MALPTSNPSGHHLVVRGLFSNGRAENERFAGTPDQAVAYFSSLIAVGVRYFIVGPATGTKRGELAMLKRLAEGVVAAVVAAGV
jgi:hypothetical protein